MGASLNIVEIPEAARKFSRVCEIVDRNERDPSRLIPILQQIQEEYRYLPEEVLALVATSLDLPPSRVYGVATFYSHFTLEPKGKHTIRLCDGTACHVRGSHGLLEVFLERLGLSTEKMSTLFARKQCHIQRDSFST